MRRKLNERAGRPRSHGIDTGFETREIATSWERGRLARLRGRSRFGAAKARLRMASIMHGDVLLQVRIDLAAEARAGEDTVMPDAGLQVMLLLMRLDR